MSFPIQIPALLRALEARGYQEPTPVQQAVLVPEAADRDLLVSAQTGSGKTVAFGLAIAPTLMGENETLPATHNPLALVIAPTRELALQVHAELTWLYEYAGGRILSCVGGMDARREARQLAAGCHIVVGTPGRLQDHIERGNLKLDELEAVILDEADEMLDLGFRDELEFILSSAPAARRTLLFSATIAKEIATLARQYQHNALRIDTVARNQPHADIEYRAVLVAGHELEAGLVNLLRLYETRALIFCATRDAVRHLHANLLARGFNAVALSGELSQNERNAALNALRDGRAQICIATDVAARGLDLPELDLVIHAELPTNKATFLHRSGRTGRAGRKGICLLLVPPAKRRRTELLLSQANIQPIWQTPPTPAEIRARDQERLLEDPRLTPEPTDEERSLAQAPAPRAPKPRTTGDQPTGNWFRLPLGRKQNADPRWMIPLICNAGNVTKQEIGAIRIFDRETKFEIAPHAVENFYAAIAVQTGELRIEPASPPNTGRPHQAARPAKTIPTAKPHKATKPGKPSEQQRRRQNKSAKGLR
jgi:ATP-dependent RNA helicase DeaD